MFNAVVKLGPTNRIYVNIAQSRGTKDLNGYLRAILSYQ
jgi:hypothetical protein